MNIICLDFETFFSAEYTLKKMTTEAYIRDPRFAAHGCAIKWSASHTPVWYDAAVLPQIFAQVDWTNTAIICHHAQFDGLILSHHYGVRPKFWFDTLSMARLLLGNHVSVSLDSVRKHFNMPAKRTPYELFRGYHWQELAAPYRLDFIAAGACDEVESIWRIFAEFMKTFPREELELIDITVRMFTEPVLLGDRELLGQVWTEENRKKQNALSELNVPAAALNSNAQFIALLEAEGVEIQYKDGKNGPIPAFAKSDEFMQDLLEDDNPRIAALAAARLGQKSTLLQTRAEAIGWMASRGPLCIYLRYCGAHTTRWSGGDGTNFQNMPARKKEARRLRQSIMAPDGYLLAKPDSSQIECRLLNFVAGQVDMVELFRTGGDPYVGLASEIYGETVEKLPKDHPRAHEMEVKRGAGKQGELMCGYGAGWRKYQQTAKIGQYGPSVELSDLDAQRHVAIYRQRHPAVVQLWKEGDRMLNSLANNEGAWWRCVDCRNHRIILPNGAPLLYDTLEWHTAESGEQFWRLKTRKGWHKMWGGVLVENLIQALARVITGQAMIRIARRGYKICTMSHDDVAILIPRDGHQDRHLEVCLEEMKQEPAWLPGIPLGAEGSLSVRYGE